MVEEELEAEEVTSVKGGLPELEGEVLDGGHDEKKVDLSLVPYESADDAQDDVVVEDAYPMEECPESKKDEVATVGDDVGDMEREPEGRPDGEREIEEVDGEFEPRGRDVGGVETGVEQLDGVEV